MQDLFYLVDYKSKFTIIVDEPSPDDFVVGRITRDDVFREVYERTSLAEHYGVPPYLGNDDEIVELYAEVASDNF